MMSTKLVVKVYFNTVLTSGLISRPKPWDAGVDTAMLQLLGRLFITGLRQSLGLSGLFRNDEAVALRFKTGWLGTLNNPRLYFGPPGVELRVLQSKSLRAPLPAGGLVNRF